jgi:hypothetical protein
MRILFALLGFFGLGAAQAADFLFDLSGQAFLQSSPVGAFDVMFTVDSQSGELLVIDIPPPNESLELFNGDLAVTNYSAVVNGQLIHQLPVTSGLVNFATTGLGSGMEIGLGPTSEFAWSTQNFSRDQLEAALATADPLGYLFPLMSGEFAELEIGNTLGQEYDLHITSMSIRSVPVSAPEPNTVALLVLAGIGLGFTHRRRVLAPR